MVYIVGKNDVPQHRTRNGALILLRLDRTVQSSGLHGRRGPADGMVDHLLPGHTTCAP